MEAAADGGAAQGASVRASQVQCAPTESTESTESAKSASASDACVEDAASLSRGASGVTSATDAAAGGREAAGAATTVPAVPVPAGLSTEPSSPAMSPPPPAPAAPPPSAEPSPPPSLAAHVASGGADDDAGSVSGAVGAASPQPPLVVAAPAMAPESATATTLGPSNLPRSLVEGALSVSQSAPATPTAQREGSDGWVPHRQRIDPETVSTSKQPPPPLFSPTEPLLARACRCPPLRATARSSAASVCSRRDPWPRSPPRPPSSPRRSSLIPTRTRGRPPSLRRVADRKCPWRAPSTPPMPQRQPTSLLPPATHHHAILSTPRRPRRLPLADATRAPLRRWTARRVIHSTCRVPRRPRRAAAIPRIPSICRAPSRPRRLYRRSRAACARAEQRMRRAESAARAASAARAG